MNELDDIGSARKLSSILREIIIRCIVNAETRIDRKDRIMITRKDRLMITRKDRIMITRQEGVISDPDALSLITLYQLEKV